MKESCKPHWVRLAHHLTAAGETARAVDNWLKAGKYAAARLAHREAIGHFERGIAVLTALAVSPARDRWETELRLVAVYCQGIRCSRSGRCLYARPRAGGAARQSATGVHGSLRPLAIGQRCRQHSRLPELVEPAAATYCGQCGRRIASASTSRRLGDVFVCRRPGSRARALRDGTPALFLWVFVELSG